MHPSLWLQTRPQGLYCAPGDFYIDPTAAVPRAVITHGHADHARAGHGAVLATAETLAIMRVRLGEAPGRQALALGETLRLGDVELWLQPAGHVLGSAQVAITHRGGRAVISGDYKRAPDPTCAPFVPIACDVFVTEATFGLPIFVHPPAEGEIATLLANVALFPERCHLVGCYALGKAQRIIALLREAGWARPIYLHGAMIKLCETYEQLGVRLGDLRPVASSQPDGLAGEIVLAPPAMIADRWARRLADPVSVVASGWMRVRPRARASGVELPLVISDHADWPALLQTLADVDAPEVWVTHGAEAALIHEATKRGRRARALRLLGYGDEEVPEAAPA